MKELLTPEDARRILRISRTSIYGLIRTGRLKHYNVGRLVRIKACDLQRFIEGKPAQTQK